MPLEAISNLNNARWVGQYHLLFFVWFLKSQNKTSKRAHCNWIGSKGIQDWERGRMGAKALSSVERGYQMEDR